MEDLIDDQKLILAQLEDFAQIGTWVVDLKTEEVHWSKKTYEIHDEDPSKVIRLQDGISYYIPEHQPLVTKCVELAIHDGNPWDIELQIRTALGKVKWVRAIGGPIMDNNSVVKLQGLFQDIDKQKKLSIDLIETNQKLNTALNGAKIGLWTWDIEKDSLDWDAQMFELYGLHPNDFSSNFEAWTKGLHPDDRERSEAEIKAAIDGTASFDTEFRVIWPDQSIHFIRAFGNVVRDNNGRPLKVIGTNWDITSEKLSEEKFETLALELETVLDAIPGLVLHKSKEDIMIRVNKFTADLMGTTKEKMNGQPSENFYDKELCEKYHADDMEVVLSGKPKLGIIEENHDGDGNPLWLRTDKVPYRDVNGEVTGVVLCAFNITDQILAQSQLSRLNEELTQFSYRTSHDLKAPLATIRGLSQVMKGQLNSGETRDVEKNLDRIEKIAMKLEVLVKDLLDLSKAESLDEDIRSFQFEPELRSILNEINDRQEKSLTLEFNSSIQEKNLFRFQPVRLRQIFENLMFNSLKYSKPEDENPVIQVTLSEKTGRLVIEVKDFGLGIPPQYHDKVFKMFHRFHQNIGGSGLGLYLVKKHVDVMGGKISFRSSPDGTEFQITLPPVKV